MFHFKSAVPPRHKHSQSLLHKVRNGDCSSEAIMFVDRRFQSEKRSNIVLQAYLVYLDFANIDCFVCVLTELRSVFMSRPSSPFPARFRKDPCILTVAAKAQQTVQRMQETHVSPLNDDL